MAHLNAVVWSLCLGGVLCLHKENRLMQTLDSMQTDNIVKHDSKFTLSELDTTPICGVDVPVVANAMWAYSSRDGSSITYTCDVGFVTEGGKTSFDYSCVAGKPISSTQLTESCKIVKCPRPEKMANAEMVWPGGAHVTTGDFGTIVDFQCNVGYSGDGKANGPRVVKMACNAQGSFQYVLSTITSCSLVHCSPPLVLRNSGISPDIDKTVLVPFNETITYECSTGYVSSIDKTKASVSLTCGDDGEFGPNDPLPRCTESRCPDPPLLDHATTIQVSGKVGIDSRVIYRCETGFYVSEIPASSTFNIRCEFIDGEAKYVIPSIENRCKPNLCLPMPEIENAIVDSNNTAWRFTESVPFRCIPGYTLGGVIGEATFNGECNSQGMWTINDGPKCSKVVCGQPADIPADLLAYGYLRPFESPTVIYGMGTTVACGDGAVVVGSAGAESTFELVCGPEGYFVGGGMCAVPCPVVPKVSYSSSHDFGKVIEFGNGPAVISCKPGYHTSAGSADQEIVCNRDGTLSHISDCLPIPNYVGEGGEGNTGVDEFGYITGDQDVWAYQEGGAQNDGTFLRKDSNQQIGLTIIALMVLVL